MTTTPLQPVRVDSDALRSAHERALRAAVRGHVRFGAHDRALYATDASIYQEEPIGVVIPADADDLEAVVRLCAERGLPMLPRGGGTSLAGQCTNHAVVIDVSPTMRRVLSVDPEARTATVEPGITIDDLNTHLEPYGLFFAPDPSTSKQCAIGGAIGNNAAGTRSIKYGRTCENVEAIEVLLPTGSRVWLDDAPAEGGPVRTLREGVAALCRQHQVEIRERFPKTVRRNAGFALDDVLRQIDAGTGDDRLNLTPLICGSEGSLAFVTKARLKLHPLPKARGLAVVGFSSLDQAIAAVPTLLELGPSAVELLDDLVISLAKRNTEYSRYVPLMPAPERGDLEAVLYVEFFSDEGEADIEQRIERVRSTMAEHSAGARVRHIASPEDMAGALKLRKAGEPLLHALPGDRKPLGFIEDNAVPVERLGEFVTRLRAIIEKHGTRGAFYAHASVGVLHVRPLLNLRSDDDRKAMEGIATEAADLARELGGVMSGEHGDGKARGPFIERHFGPNLMEAFRDLKALFDPDGLMNPGNIVAPGDVRSIHESTRVSPSGTQVHTPSVQTHFGYEAEGGFDHAVELCNGAGVCRKTQGGTMCPSYMATLDERHSTRGRGNALRMAITGQLSASGAPAWDDAETKETLRMCLSCKACKTECPSNVDVAQYKAEYLAQSYEHAGKKPIAARVFGNVRALNKLGSRFAPLSNWVANNPLHRALANPLLGLAKERTLPRFERSLFAAIREGDWFNAGVEIDAPYVVLYADCFTAYNDPRIGIASIKLLNACGLRVLVPGVECCGRAAISTGLLDEAKRWAEEAARTLASVPNRPRGYLFCEPSCLSAVKDEWLAYSGLSDADRTRRSDVAEASMLVEDFVDRHWNELPVRPTFSAPTGQVVLHAHCHQKALWGAGTSARMLGRAFGSERVRVLDTGCCGMAGSFGYTADRYELSMSIGELKLFPRVRELDEADVLVAPGTSCRHQTHDGTGKDALHPVELLADRLEARRVEG